MARNWLGPQIYGPNDVLALCLVTVILILGSPVIALILNGFRRDYDKMESDQREAWEAHIRGIRGKELRLRDDDTAERKPLDDWGFWTLEDTENIPYP